MARKLECCDCERHRALPSVLARVLNCNCLIAPFSSSFLSAGASACVLQSMAEGAVEVARVCASAAALLRRATDDDLAYVLDSGGAQERERLSAGRSRRRG